MRVRAFASIVLVMLPAVSGAQRIGVRLPRVGSPPPTTPAPLPPKAPGITELRRYQSSRLSVETYTLFSLVQTDRYVADTVASFSMLGVGTHIDWRLKPAFSMTGDLTSAMLGGPFSLNTIELGGRLRRPESEDRGMRPYLDLRTSWAYSYASYAQPYGANTVVAAPTYQGQGGRTTSHGLGALVGAGFESSLTRSIAFTTGLSLSHNRMTAVRVAGRQLGSDFNYRTTVARFTIGLKYNAQRVVPLYSTATPKSEK